MAAWPGTPGGAASPHWGDGVRVYVYAAIYSGTTFRWAPASAPNQNADTWTTGNVWSAGTVTPAPPAGRLWVDLSCDVLDLETQMGGTRTDGLTAVADAATAQITLVDPTRKYDPLNPHSPYQFQGRSRLMPGTGIVVWAETLNAGATPTVTKWPLFTGTVDTWSEPWQPRPIDRRANVVASDATKTLSGLDRGEQPAVGAGDTVNARITRILAYYGYLGATRLDTSAVTLQATTLAQSAWELISRASEDEIGFVYLDANGTLQFYARPTWATTPAPKIVVGCSPTVSTDHDIVTDANVAAADLNLRNEVSAGRTGGVTQIARSQVSIDQFGTHGYKRTDLGLANDTQAGAWATYVVTLLGWPRARIDQVTMRPALDQSWPAVLGVGLVADRVRVVWTPPDDQTVTYDTTGRVLGIDHHITHQAWDVTWSLAYADLYSRVFRWGPAETDRLTVGNVWAPTTTG